MKGIRKRSISVLMTLVMLVGILADLRWGFSAVEVLAAINAIINNDNSYLKIGDEKCDVNETYTLDLSKGDDYPIEVYVEWFLANANGAKAGETIIVELPKSILFEDVNDGTMTNGSYQETFTLKDNIITINLQHDLSTENKGINGLKGTIKGTGDGPISNGQHSVEIFGKKISINVINATSTSKLTASKDIQGNYNPETGYQYRITVYSSGNNSNIELNDIFQQDMILTSDITVTSSLGNTVSGSLDRNENGFTYKVKPDYTMVQGETLTFTYTAKIPDNTYNSFNGTMEIKNLAKITSKEGGQVDKWASGWLSRNLVSKNGQLSSDGQSINWTITVNSTNPVDISGGVLSDIMQEGLEINSKVIMTSSKGETIVIPTDGKGFNYQFPDGSDAAYTIHFTTKADTSKFPILDGGSYSNTAYLTIDNHEHPGSASVTIPGIGDFHTKKATSYKIETIGSGASQKECGVITWTNTITVPESVSLNNFVFYDNGASWQQTAPQKMKAGSLSVSYNGIRVSPSNYAFKMLGNDDTFQIDFGNYFAGARPGDVIVISYDTYFDLVTYDTWIYNYSQIKLNDRVVSNANDSYHFVPLLSKSIIGTEDTANGLNKIFKWCVKIDASNDALPDTLLFKDLLPENHKLVGGTVELWDSMWWTDPGRVKKYSEKIIDSSTFTVTINKNDLSNGFVYLHYNTTFADENEYLTGGKKEYINTMEVYDKESLIDRASATTGLVNPPDNKVLDKSLVRYDRYSGGYADYAIDVNAAARKYLENGGKLTLTDTMGSALKYVAGSLKIFNVAEDCELEADEYTLQYDTVKNQLILTLPDAMHCYITYKVKVESEHKEFQGDEGNNEVTLTGVGNNSVTDSAPLQGTVYEATGKIITNSAYVALFKSDFENFAKALEGAEYTVKIVALWDDGPIPATDEELANRNINNSVMTQETGKDGKLSFTGLRYDCLYEITETKAPDGYQISKNKLYIYFVGKDGADFETVYKNVEPYKNYTIKPIIRKDDDISDLYYEMSEEMLVRDRKLPAPLKYIQISKQAFGDDSKELAGATLQLLDKDNNNDVVTEWTTGESCRKFYIRPQGEFNPDDYDEILLVPGTTYELVEKAAPNGYAVAEPIEFQVTADGEITSKGSISMAGDIATLTMKDNHAIYINKVDSDGNTLSDAKLIIYSTDKNNYVEVSGSKKLKVSDKEDLTKGVLKYDTEYTLSEPGKLDGYKKIDNIQFKVDNAGKIYDIKRNSNDEEECRLSDDGLILTVTDKTLVRLQIIKQDTKGNKLEGVEFTLQCPDGTTKNFEETDEKGITAIDNLTYGDYVIVETPLDGYEIISEKTPITLGGSNGEKIEIIDGVATVTKVITNVKTQPSKATIEITKIDKDDNNKLLQGAQFTLENAEYKATATTNEKGVAKFSDVPYGTYTLTEENSPYGYKFSTGDTYKKDNNTLKVDSNNYCEITLNDSTVVDYKYALSVTNTQLFGSLSFTKMGSDNRPVFGAEFTLTDKDGKVVSEGKSDEDGNVSLGIDEKTGNPTIPYGTYILKETAPNGYIGGDIEREGIQVTINSDTINPDTDTDTNTVDLGTIENIRQSVFIDKQSSLDGTAVEGAVLGIYPADGPDKDTPLAVWKTGALAKQFYLCDSADTMKNLNKPNVDDPAEANSNLYIVPNKSYTLKEVEVPDSGYFKEATSINFEVKYDSNGTAIITSDGNENNVLVMKDDPIGTLRLIKQSSSEGQEILPGAIFELYKDVLDEKNKLNQADIERLKLKSGEFKDQYDTDDESYNNVFVTNDKGEIVVSGLPYGTYIFKEVCSPDGYSITNEITTFVLSATSRTDSELHTEEQIVYNTPKTEGPKANIEIIKVDSLDNATGLENARFELYRKNEDGSYEFIVGNTTNSAGIILFEDIPCGIYTLYESQSPQNYKFSGECQVFIDNKKSDIINFEPLEVNVLIDIAPEETGKTITIKVENELCPFYIQKIGKDTNGNGLNDAQFALYNNKACRPEDKVYPTGNDFVTTTTMTFGNKKIEGIAEFKGIPYGTYWLKEEKAPDDYERNEEPIKIEINDDTIKRYTENDPLQISNDRIKLYVKKLETGTNSIVNNAGLAIYKYDKTNQTYGDLVSSWNSGTDLGQVLYFTKDTNSTKRDYVYPGTFILKETNVPSNYKKAPDILFDVSEIGEIENITRLDKKSLVSDVAKVIDNNRTLILYDEPCGSVQITKTDAENSDIKVPDAEFAIYHAEGLENIESFDDLTNRLTPEEQKNLLEAEGTTDENGTLTFKELPFGNYVIFETKVPTGYRQISQRYDVTITASEKEIKLSITNIQEDKTGNIKLTKTSKKDGTALSGAVFKLVKVVDGKEVEVARGKTDEPYGIVEFNNVLYGEYEIIEVTPPEGYSVKLEDARTEPKDEEKYRVLDDKTIKVSINEKTCPMKIDGTPDTISINVTDDILRGNLEALKVAKVDGVDAGLEGVYFALMDGNGDYFDGDYISSVDDITDERFKETYWFVTDASGKLSIENIPFGTYTLVEVSAPSYVKWNETSSGVVEVAKNVKIDKDNSQPGFMPTIVPEAIKNTLSTKDFTIRKIGDEWSKEDVANVNKGLEGAVYELYSDVEKDENGKVIGLKDLVATAVTDSTGRYTFLGLVHGTYYLKEKTAPSNYMIDKEYKVVEISDSGITMQDEEITTIGNVSDPIGRGSLVITKKGLGEELLPGVEFKLHGVSLDGKPIERTGITDGSGIVSFDELAYGYYMVQEVSAPEYYVALEEIKDSIPVTADYVNDDGRVIQPLEITNQNISFRISKRAAGTIYDLKGATLGIFDVGTSENNFTTSAAKIYWDTSDTGPHEIYLGENDGKLKPGTYLLAEINAPDGYYKANPMKFSVNKKGEVTLLDAGMTDDPLDKRTKGELSNVAKDPETGETVSNGEYQYPILIMYDDEITSNIAIGKKVQQEDGSISEKLHGGIGFKIVKADSAGNPVGEPIISWESQEEPRLISVGNGKVLSYETDYLLIEESAPAGLMLAEDPVPFYINRKGEIKIGSVNSNARAAVSQDWVSKYAVNDETTVDMLTMVDNVWDGSFYISKRELDKMEALPKAELWLINTEDPNDVKTWVTSAQPRKFTVGSASDQIKPGVEYILHEAAAPEGYMLAPDIKFEISENAVVTVHDNGNGYVEIKGGIPTIVMQDAVLGSKEDDMEPVPDAFTDDNGSPKTGDDTPLVLLIILLVIAAAAIAGLAITGRKKAHAEKTEDEEDEN